MKRPIRKIISLVLVFTFTVNSVCYGLATLPASQNPVVKREILAALDRTQIRYAESEDAKRLLEANNASCLLLSSGKYLVTKEVADNDLKLLRAIIHEDIEAIMQITAKEDRNKYQAIKESILKYFPPDKNNKLPIDLYVNHTVARAFEWLALLQNGIIVESEVPPDVMSFINVIRPIIMANKHSYFTAEFWDSKIRGNRIKEALNNGMIFYNVANNASDKDEISTELMATIFSHVPTGKFSLERFCRTTGISRSTAKTSLLILAELDILGVVRWGDEPEFISLIPNNIKDNVAGILQEYKDRSDMPGIARKLTPLMMPILEEASRLVAADAKDTSGEMTGDIDRMLKKAADDKRDLSDYHELKELLAWYIGAERANKKKSSEIKGETITDVINNNEAYGMIRYGDVVFSTHNNGEIIVVGDVHGDDISLANFLSKIGFVAEMKKSLPERRMQIVFTGDYSNNGMNSIGSLIRILKLKKEYPDNVILLSGNHEKKEALYSVLAGKYGLQWNNEHGAKLAEEQKNMFGGVKSYNHIVIEAMEKFGAEAGGDLNCDLVDFWKMLPYICFSRNGIMISHSLGVEKSRTVVTLRDLTKAKEAVMPEWGMVIPFKSGVDLYSSMTANREINPSLLEMFEKLGVKVFICGHDHWRSGDIRFNNRFINISASNMYSPESSNYIYQELHVKRRLEKGINASDAFPCCIQLNLAKECDVLTEEMLIRDEPLYYRVMVYLKEKNISVSAIHPDSYKVLMNESAILETDNIDWMLRSIFGKVSGEEITNEEIRHFFSDGKIRTSVMIFSPKMRPGDMRHSDRLKKDVPIKAGNRPYSPVIGEALTHALANTIQERLNITEIISRCKQEGRQLVVVGKYTGGLVPGMLIADKFNLPFVTLTKLPFNFTIPQDSGQVIRVKEPHLPADSEEFYSYMLANPNTSIIIVDDESTTGIVHTNTVKELEKMGIRTEAVVVLMQSSDEAKEKMLKESGVPYIYMNAMYTNNDWRLKRPAYLPFSDSRVVPDEPLLYPKNEVRNGKEIQFKVYHKESDTVFVDHSLKGMTMPLEPSILASAGEKISKFLAQTMHIQDTRKKYYEKGKTLYIVGATPSGLYAGLGASQITRIPLLGATNRPEPVGYEDTVNYVGLDGHNYSIYGLKSGDGVILITGELTDGEEQARIIKSLRDKGVDVVCSVSAVENEYYSGRNKVGSLGIPIHSPKTYKANEGIYQINISSRVRASFIYAVEELNRIVKGMNSEAEVVEILGFPSSFTRSLMIEGSDMDEVYIYVKGVSQTQLNGLNNKFISWLNRSDMTLFDDNAKPPILISTESREAMDKTYETDEMPLVTIYDEKGFRNENKLAELSNRSRAIHPKQVARIKLLLALGELDLTHIRALLDGEENKNSLFHKELEEILVKPDKSEVSQTAKKILEELDRLYRENIWVYAIADGKEKDFENILFELCEIGLIKIIDNRMILMWRLHTARWSDRFWTRRFEVKCSSSKDDIKAQEIIKRITSRLTKDFTGYAESEFPKLVLSQDPVLAEQAIRYIRTLQNIPDATKDAILKALGGAAFVDTAAIDVIVDHRSLFESRVKGAIQESIKLGDLKGYFNKKQKKLHLLINILFRWALQEPRLADDINGFIYDNIIKDNEIICKTVPPMILQSIIENLGEVYKHLNDLTLKKNVHTFVLRSSFSYIYRTRVKAREALKKIEPQMPNTESMIKDAAVNKNEVATAKELEDRRMLYDVVEKKRKSGDPVACVVSDFDDCLLRSFTRGARCLNPAVSFWLNWLTRRNISVAIVTGSGYERIYDRCFSERVKLPLEKNSNLHFFTDTGAYYNDRPVSYQDIPDEVWRYVDETLSPEGWMELKDGRLPRKIFINTNTDQGKATTIAKKLKAYLASKRYYYDIVVSRWSGTENCWTIKIFAINKVSNISKISGIKASADRILALFDDAGEFGIDKPFMDFAKKGIRVNVGYELEQEEGLLQLKTKNEDGSRLAIEALVASIITEIILKDKNFQWNELIEDLKRTEAFSSSDIEKILAPVRELVDDSLSSIRSRDDKNETIGAKEDSNHMDRFLDIIEIYPTDLCVLGCRGCTNIARHHAGRQINALPIETIDKLKEFRPKQIRIVGGGEPTLYKYKEYAFNDLIARIRTNLPDARLGMATNGVYIPAGDWQKQLAWVGVSLYGASREDFLKYTGEDKFDIVMNNIFDEYYLNSPIPDIRVTFFYSRENIKLLPSLIKQLWEQWNATVQKDKDLQQKKRFLINLSPYVDDTRPEDPFASSNLTDEEMREYGKQLRDIENDQPELWNFIKAYASSVISRPFEKHVSPSAQRCPMASRLAVLAADQHLYPCFFMANTSHDHDFGSINDLSPERLLEIRRQHYINPPERCKQSCHPGATYTGKVIKRSNGPVLFGYAEGVGTINGAVSHIGQTDSRRIAITGATGDIGVGLSRLLLNKGCSVTALMRSDPLQEKQAALMMDSKNFSYKKGDIFSKKAIEEILNKGDVVYHLAAIVGQDINPKMQASVLSVNAFGTALLAWLASKSKSPPAIVYASSQRCYGVENDPRAVEWMKKILDKFRSERDKIFSLSDGDIEKAITVLSERILKEYPLPEGVAIYDISKLMGEELLKELPNVVIARIANVYGPECHSGRLMQRLIENRFSDGSKREEDENRDYVYTDDVSKILYELGKEQDAGLKYLDVKPRVVDIASGKKISTEDAWEVIKKFTPDQKGHLEIVASSKKSADQDGHHAEQLLGRSFCGIETGIRNIIDEYRYKQRPRTTGESGTIVFDIGGTSIRTGIFYPDGLLDIISKDEAPNYNIYQGASGEYLQQKLIDYIKGKIEEARKITGNDNSGIILDRVAISFPGPVIDYSIIDRAPTLWGTNTKSINLSNVLKRNVSGLKDVRVIHDISADAIRYAVEKKKNKFCVVTISSGISCRIYDKEKGGLITDEFDLAGEIGHLKIDYSKDAPLCECGERGHLNAFSSGRAAERIMREKAAHDPDGFRQSLLYEYTNGDASKFNNAMFADAIAERDEWALKILKELAKPVAYAINQISAVSGIRDFYLVGGFAIAHGDVYLNDILENLREIRLLNRAKDYFEGHIELGYSDDADGMRGAGYFTQYNKIGIDNAPGNIFSKGHVKKFVDGKGGTYVEALAPTELSYKNYFTKGVFEESNPILAQLCSVRKSLMVIDEAVYVRWKDAIDRYIWTNKLDCTILSLPGGESAKDIDYTEAICTRASDLGLDRKGIIITVGGGAIMDVAGLAAQLYRRGVDYIRIPTTLLGMIDAAVGVKVGINYKGSKNFLGAFYPPKYVISDTEFLATVPEREMRSGAAEIIKVALISNSRLFEMLEKHSEGFVRNIKFEGYDQFIEDATIELLKHLQMDFYEHDLMRHVDFGHTMAHYFESVSNYEMTHGEAVAIDILISAYIARERGILSSEDFDRIVALHKKLGLPFYHPAISIETMWSGVQKAISHKGGHLMMVVPKKIGQTAFIDSLSKEELAGALEFLKFFDKEKIEDDSEKMQGVKSSPAGKPAIDIPFEKIRSCLIKSKDQFPEGVIDAVVNILEKESQGMVSISDIKQKYPDRPESAKKRIVFTGSVYGGKTTFLRHAAMEYRKDTVYLPEIAPSLIDGGIKINPDSYIEQTNVQRLIFILKYLLEVETSSLHPDKVVLCERGTLDGMAWWPGKTADFEEEFGGVKGELERYGHVIFVESVASTTHAQHELKKRYENVKLAQAVDLFLKKMYAAHNSFYEIPHTDWDRKTEELNTTLASLHRSISGEDKNLSRGNINETSETHPALDKAVNEGRMFAVTLEQIDKLHNIDNETLIDLLMSNLLHLRSPPETRQKLIDRLQDSTFKQSLIKGFALMGESAKGKPLPNDKPIRLCIVIEDENLPTIVFKDPYNNLIAHSGKGEKTSTPYTSIYAGYNSLEVAFKTDQEDGFKKIISHEADDIVRGYHLDEKIEEVVTSSEDEIKSATQICGVFKQNHIVASYTAGRDIVKPGSPQIADGLALFNRIFDISRTRTKRSIEASCEDLSRAQTIATSPLRKEIDITYHLKKIGGTIINLASEKPLEVIENPDSELFQIVKTLQPENVSLHLGWSAEEIELGTEQNLLPDRSISPVLERNVLLDRITKNLAVLQSNLKKVGYNKPVLIETLNYCNSGAYEYITEPDFVKEVLRLTGTRLLADCAHILVSAKNNGLYEPKEYMKYVKALMNEETIGLVDEVHLSVPEVVSPAHYEDMHRPLYSDTIPAQEVREILRYILTLRADKSITHPIVVNFETGIQNAEREIMLLSRWIQTAISNHHLEKIYESGEPSRPSMKDMPRQIVCNEQLKDLFEFQNGAWDWKRGDGLTLLGGLPFEGSTRGNFNEILSLLRGVEPEPQNLYTHRIDTLHFTIAELMPNTDRVNDIPRVNNERQNKLNGLQSVCAGIGPIKVRFYYKDLAITEGGDIVALGYVDNDGLFTLRGRLQSEGISSKYTKIVHVTMGRVFDENVTPEKLEKYKRVISNLKERKGKDGEPQLLSEITITEARVWDQRCETNELRHGKGHPSISFQNGLIQHSITNGPQSISQEESGRVTALYNNTIDIYDAGEFKVLWFDVLDKAFQEDGIYKIKYDTSRLTNSQIAIIKEYVRLLNMKTKSKFEAVGCSSLNGSKEALLTVYRQDRAGNIKGKGCVDIDVPEGDSIEQYVLRIAGMLNLALAASNIEENLSDENNNPIAGFIKRQCRLMIGDSVAIPDNLIDLIKFIRNLPLPKASRIPTEKIEKYNKLAREALTAA